MHFLPEPGIATRTLLAGALMIGAGCQVPPAALAAAQVDAPAAQQLIVKFKAGAVACDAAGIAQLSAETHVRLEYYRPMSGDACVIRQSADNADALRQGQEILKQHPAVEWLEPDRLMKAL